MPAAVASTAALPSASDGSATTWTMPSWSRRSTKQRPPRSRATSAQPHRVTVSPTRDSSIRPQKWVRIWFGRAGKPSILRASDGRFAGKAVPLPSSQSALSRRPGGPPFPLRFAGARGRRFRFRLLLGGLGLGRLGAGGFGGVAGEVALAFLLEVGLVPAAAGEAEAGGGHLAADGRLAALGAGLRIGIGQLLQAVELVAAGIAGEGVDRH